MELNDVPIGNRHNDYCVVGRFFTKADEWQLAQSTDTAASLIREEAKNYRQPSMPDYSRYEEGRLIVPPSRLNVILRVLGKNINDTVRSLLNDPRLQRTYTSKRGKAVLEIAGLEITHRKIDDQAIEVRVIIGKHFREIIAAQLLQQESWHAR